MTDAWYLEVHDPTMARGSLLSHHIGLTEDKAVVLMERHRDFALLLRQLGQSTESDHDALRRFQIRTGKRLVRC